MKFEKLLLNIYPEDDAKDVLKLLEQYHLASVLETATDKVGHFIKAKTQEQENSIITTVGTLTSSFLLSINSKLTPVPASDEKKKIELIISDIAFELIKEILDSFSGDRRLLLNAMYESSKITCEFNGYNFGAVEQLMPFQKYIALQPQHKGIKLPFKSFKPVFYKWISNKYNLNDLSETLKSKNIIKRVRDFHKLFEQPKEQFTICFNQTYNDELIVLFDLLYARKHISPVGTKGHFFPLQQYSVDFENQFLLKKEPKTIKYTLKKNKIKWAELNERVGKWMVNFK